jgi:hypothetical protein
MRQHVIDEMLDSFRHTFAEAARAEAPALATEPHRRVVRAARAKSQDEAILKDAAFEVVAQLLGDALRHGAAFSFALSDKRLNIRR